MPCPLYSREDNDCCLVQAVVDEHEEHGGPVVPEAPADLSLCLAQDATYRRCAVYRRQVAESLS